MPKPFSSATQTRSLSLVVALVLTVLGASAYTVLSQRAWFPSTFYLEATMRSARSGFAQLYFDIGGGVNERDSTRLPLENRSKPVKYQFRLPQGNYKELRFDPTDRARNAMTLSDVRVVDREGHLIRTISPAEIKAAQQIDNLERSDTEVRFTTSATASDPILAIEFTEPLILKGFAKPSFRKLARRFFLSFAVFGGFVLAASRLRFSKVEEGLRPWLESVSRWGSNHHRQLICAVSAASVIISCYPVVFFGKSFVSPNNHSHTFLLYDEMPTVPGYKEVETDDEKGADLGAAMWYSWPASVVESRALFKDFELPLWNRYDSSGLPLLGQGQSMFGDPMHLLVLLTSGAAGWWDLKYLLAKFLFAASLGFCVLHLTKHAPAAVIVALSAPFIGFYSYRYSHPAFFSLSYAPLILLCWFKLINRSHRRVSASWLIMMALANWMMLNSGTVKEAYILLLAMNFCGAITLLLGNEIENKIAKLRQALGVLFLFILIATPVWLTFLNTLRNSWTVYDAGSVFQLQPSLLVGLFDDIFYQQFNVDELHLDPSANFLVLGAVLWFCFTRRSPDSQRLAWGLIITALLALSLVFAVVPPWLILQIPFLDRIYHIDNTFSCVAIVCLLLLAGFGMRAFWDDCRARDLRRTWLRSVIALTILVAFYLGATEAGQRSTRTFLRVGEHIPKSPFFWGYSFLIVASLVILPWVARWALHAENRGRLWAALFLASIFLLIHWRFGMHLETEFDPYVMNPQERVDLVAQSSPAVQLIKSNAAEPSRTVGIGSNFFPGYGGAIGVEQIDAADPLLNPYYKGLINIWGLKVPFGNGGRLDEKLGDDLSLLNMLNVRYYLDDTSAKEELPPSVPKLASLDLDVYESRSVWPRAFFVNQLTSYGAEGDFISLLKHGDGKPFAAISQIELEKQANLHGLILDPSNSPPRQIVAATDYSLTNNTTSFKIRSSSPGVVVLTEPYIDNDFQLRLNTKITGYFRVNSAFRAVFIPKAGEYDISFTYWPSHLTVSLWISGLGLFLFALWVGLAWRQSQSVT